MASGDRSRTWFPEMVSQLRASWRSDASWGAIIDLRNAVQQTLETILASRGIKPATFRCPCCGEVGPGAPPVVSVRAMLLALRRFEIEENDVVRRLEKAWAKYRELNQLDLYGAPAGSSTTLRHQHDRALAQQGFEADEP